MGRYGGKCAVITGGTSGIGLATAQLLVQESVQEFMCFRWNLLLGATEATGSRLKGHGRDSDILFAEQLRPNRWKYRCHPTPRLKKTVNEPYRLGRLSKT
jgi:NAD(P)-dependent dehydrogenase (short-subunit alcohol dehydrogenase family)